jgi:hypothetical protein
MGIKDPPLITTKIIDRLVTYVLYHSGQDKPVYSDMISK